MEAIYHLDLVVTDLERGLTFYRGLLGPLGYVGEAEIEGERGERVVYLSRHAGRGSLSLREAQSSARETPYDRYGVGIHHICFGASSRLVVDTIATWVRDESQGEIESGPKEYGYTPGYYAVFVHDPDGIKIEVLHRPSEGDLTERVLELERRVAELGSS